MNVHTFVHHILNQYSEKVRSFDINTQMKKIQKMSGSQNTVNWGTSGLLASEL